MQPNLPELPAMKPNGDGADGGRSPAQFTAPATQRTPYQGSRRLRQIVGYIAGGSFAVVATICVGELVLREDLRPTTIAATIEAQTEMGIFNQKMGAKPGEKLMTEDEYRAKLAEAERAGQAKAEIVFQRELMAVQADKERVVNAYGALYQRTNIIAQAGVQMEAAAQQFRQQLIQQTNGGRAVVINVYDGLCAFGSEEACEKARQARRGMIQESAELTEGDLAKKVAQLMAGVPDPAALVAGADMRRNGSPSIQR